MDYHAIFEIFPKESGPKFNGSLKIPNLISPQNTPSSSRTILVLEFYINYLCMTSVGDLFSELLDTGALLKENTFLV